MAFPAGYYTPISAFTRFRFCNSSGLTATPLYQRRVCASDTVGVVAGSRAVISMGVPGAI